MSFVRPKNAFVVHIDDNGKKFAFTHYKDGNDRKMAIMFGKYTDERRTVFKVVKIKKFGAVIDKKYKDLNDPETVRQILEPYMKNIRNRSEDINGI
jgi:hypothetical protein